MRARRILELLALAALLAGLGFGISAYLAFRQALSARLDRAAAIEAAVTRPGAAARLASALAERRLALVTEKESTAVSGAFRRETGAPELEAYRKAGGDPSVAREAEKALAAKKPAEPEGDVAFLRAMRRLREEAERMPVPARPVPPVSAGAAGRRLLWVGVAAVAAALLARAAGRAA
ncbi:MAG: hypothetical protein ABR576_13845 [Thermoanaerobaculia bacterium]